MCSGQQLISLTVPFFVVTSPTCKATCTRLILVSFCRRRAAMARSSRREGYPKGRSYMWMGIRLSKHPPMMRILSIHKVLGCAPKVCWRFLSLARALQIGDGPATCYFVLKLKVCWRPFLNVAAPITITPKPTRITIHSKLAPTPPQP